MSNHHPYGPSALARYEACPGYRPREHDDSVHPVTEAGSRVHEALETKDYSILQSDTEMELVRLIEEWESKNLPQGSDWTHRREERVEIPVPGVPADVGTPFGTFDHFLYRLHEGILVDYKAGYHPVTDAEANIQLQAYILGLMAAYPQVVKVRAYILQPRIDRVSYHTYTRDDLVWIERRLQNAITKAVHVRRHDARELKPCYANCVYCGAKADCPAISRLAYRVVKEYKPDITAPGKTAHASEVTDGHTMGRLLDIAKILEDWAASVKFHAEQLYITTGEEIEGYVPVTRAGRRTISDPIRARAVARQFGVSDEDFLAACSVSVPDLSSAVSASAKRGDKKKVVGEFTDKLRDEGIYHSANPTTYLKRNSDQ